MRKIERIRPPETVRALVRVAAYARISLETDRTPKSLSAQVSHYSKLIQSTPGWVYAGVYADSGISGTTTNRPQFQAMLEAARAGEIDLILTKSISRFARNTVDLLKVVRELKGLGVEVRFEKENISTFSKDGELILTLLASVAQAESEQISQNVKWRIRKRFEQGKANGFHLYGYTDSVDGTDVEIVEAEAEVVRWIYGQYLKKISCEKMCQLLNESKAARPKSGRFSPESVRAILKNPTYTGKLLLGRWATPEGKPGRAVRNNGQLPKYLVNDAIPAIISDELFDEVQAEIARRRSLGAKANWSIPTVTLTSKIKCAVCGCSFVQAWRRPRSQNSITTGHWICNERKKGSQTKCGTSEISDTAFKKFIAEVLGMKTFDDDVFTQRVDHIDVTGKDHYTFYFTDGTSQTRTWRPELKKASWTPAKRAAWSELVKARWENARKLGIDGNTAPTPPEALAKYRAVAAAEAKRLRAERGER